jgi:hypothetical protein
VSEDKRCAQNDAKCETKTRSRFVLVRGTKALRYTGVDTGGSRDTRRIRGTKALRYRLTQKFPRVDLVMAYTLAAN